MQMNEQKASLKKANIRLAFFLGGVAVLLALWPLYLLRQGLGS